MSEYVFRTDEPIGGCAKCPMRHRQGSAWCQYLLKWTPTNEEIERREDCPLVELPPHGKLISTDVLQRELYKLLYSPQISRMNQDEVVEYIIDDIVDKASTVLGASEVKA